MAMSTRREAGGSGLGLGATLVFLIVAEALTFSSAGTAIYAGVTAGTPGANVAALAFPPLPPLPPGSPKP